MDRYSRSSDRYDDRDSRDKSYSRDERLIRRGGSPEIDRLERRFASSSLRDKDRDGTPPRTSRSDRYDSTREKLDRRETGSRHSSGRSSPTNDRFATMEPLDIRRPLGGARSSARASAGRLGRDRRSKSEHIYNLHTLDLNIPKRRPEDDVEELYHRLPSGMLSPKSERLRELSEKIKKERRKSERLRMKGKMYTRMADNYKSQIDDYEESRDRIRKDTDDLRKQYKSETSDFTSKYRDLKSARVVEDLDEKEDEEEERSLSRRSSGGRSGDRISDYGLSRRSDRRDDRRRSKDDSGGRPSGTYWMTRAERRDSLRRDTNRRSKKGSLARQYTM